MRQPLACLTTPCLTAALLALAAPGAPAQEGQPTNQIHYPLADELAGILRSADAARAEGKLKEAVELYRSVLDADLPKTRAVGYQVAPVPAEQDAAGALQPRRFKGVTQWAIEGLRALPPEGKAIFRQRFDYRARSARDEALQTDHPYRALARVYELYPIASCAPEVLENMGELALERGEVARAYRTFLRLLELHGDELPNPPGVRQKLLLCAVGLGRPQDVRAHAEALLRDDPEGELHLSDAPVAVQELIARALEIRAVRAGARGELQPDIPMSRVDAGNRAEVDVPAAIGAARFPPKTYDRPRVSEGAAGGRQFHPGTLSQTAPARNLPLVHGGSGFVVTADKVTGFDLRTGQELPRIPRLGPAFSDPNPKVQFGAAIERGVLVAPLVEEVRRDQQYRGIPIKVRIPIRKLAGFELDPWRWSWNHAASLRDTRLATWSFPTPPVADEGVVFASAFSIEGFVNCFAAAFDARTGEPLWDTWVASGQVEQTMFGEHAIEPLCTPVGLDVDRGVIVHGTSFGCAAGLDADTGRILWVTEYDQIEVRAPRGYYADPRNISWENNAPVIEDGVAILAPLDSEYYYGLEARTGRMEWRYRRREYAVEADMRYLIGASEGKVVLGGGHEVRCRDVKSGKVLWKAPLRGRVVAGRGVIAGGTVVVPVDNEAFLFDLETGKLIARSDLSASGNVVVCGEHIVVAGSDGKFAVHRNRGFEGGSSSDARRGEGRDF